MLGYRWQSLPLTSGLEREEMTGHFAQSPRDRCNLRFSVLGMGWSRSHVIHDLVRYSWSVRLFCIVYRWIPNSLEYWRHILVQTCCIFCHSFSFRPNKFFRSLHDFKRQVLMWEKLRVKQRYLHSSQHPTHYVIIQEIHKKVKDKIGDFFLIFAQRFGVNDEQ